MDRQEFEYRVEQVRKLYLRKDYKTIAAIADKIEWRKVKSASLSIIAAEAYEGTNQQAKAKAILLSAYEKGPVTRQLLFKVALFTAEHEPVADAMDFYKEFKEMAPNDTGVYILKYVLAKRTNGHLKDRIKILELYNDLELEEKWKYELARLYKEAEMDKKCVDLCDEIILWFADGEYVKQAMELKMTLEPLTANQQEKYEKLLNPEPAAVAEEKKAEPDYDEESDVQPEEVDSDDEAPEIGKIDEDLTKEQELAKTQVINLDYLTSAAAAMEERVQEEIVPEVSAGPVIDYTFEDIAFTELEKILYQDNEGQLSLRIEELLQEDEQIEGQMSFADLIAGYEQYLEKGSEEAKKAADEAEEKLNLVRAAREAAQERMKAQKEEEAARAESMREAAVADTDRIIEEAVAASAEEVEAPAENSEEEELAETEEIEEETEEEILAEALTEEQEAEEELPEEEAAKTSGAYTLTKEHRTIFEEHLLNKNMEPRITDAINKLIDRNDAENALYGQGAIITGDARSGKTTLIINIIKVANAECGRTGHKIAKIKGKALNSKDIADTFAKLENTDLIIESASEIEPDKMKELLEQMKADKSKRIVVLEDTAVAVSKIKKKNPALSELFGIELDVEELTVKQWASYAKAYAKTEGYTIDEMGMLALHARINEFNKSESRLTSQDVEDIIDEAIENAGRKGFGKLLKLGKKNAGSEKVLYEKDFV